MAISALSLLAPQLTHLEIKLPGGCYKLSLNHATVEALKCLPLRSLALSEISLAPGIGWSDILNALSGIEVLRLWCDLECQDLESFSRYLPRLRRLEVRFVDFKVLKDSRGGIYRPKSDWNADTPFCLKSGISVRALDDDGLLDRVAR
ncbi:hypothetical protein FRC07_009206, partial [Ceratobasidium sp. 392]